MMHLSSLKVNSIGSSIVTTWQPLALIDVLQHRGDGRRFSRAGNARQDHDALVVAGDLAQDRRQPQPLEIGDRGIDPPRHQAEPPALAEQVDAEPRLVAVGFEDDVGEVDAAGIFQDGLLARREQRKHQPLHVVQRSAAEAASAAIRRPAASRAPFRPSSAGRTPCISSPSGTACLLRVRWVGLQRKPRQPSPWACTPAFTED